MLPRLVALGCLLLTLGGCAVYPAAPAPYGYYAPPAASVYVAPRPYYSRPYYGYRPYYWGWGWRRWY